jgi:hypothetical protein
VFYYFSGSKELNTKGTEKINPSVHQSTKTENPVDVQREDLNTFLSHPHNYKRRQMTESEIEAINVCTDYLFCFWFMYYEHGFTDGRRVLVMPQLV